MSFKKALVVVGLALVLTGGGKNAGTDPDLPDANRKPSAATR